MSAKPFPTVIPYVPRRSFRLMNMRCAEEIFGSTDYISFSTNQNILTLSKQKAADVLVRMASLEQSDVVLQIFVNFVPVEGNSVLNQSVQLFSHSLVFTFSLWFRTAFGFI